MTDNLPARVYLGNLAFEARAEDLIPLLESFGRVVSVQIVTDIAQLVSKGFAFAEFADAAAAVKAIAELNEKLFMGRPLRVGPALARTREGARPGGFTWRPGGPSSGTGHA